MSGFEVIICYAHERFEFLLYPKSPNDLDKFNPPFTRPI